jgi:hypothetical protein
MSNLDVFLVTPHGLKHFARKCMLQFHWLTAYRPQQYGDTVHAPLLRGFRPINLMRGVRGCQVKLKA